jgi:phytoene synthase
VRFSPASLRQDLALLLAWRHQVRAILERVTDPGVARLKLQWWREELQHTYDGEPRHPLSAHLRRILARHALPAGPFLEMAHQVEEEILRRRPANAGALTEACEHDLGALFELLTRCHGTRDPAQVQQARTLGAFCALVYLIRDSGALARSGRTVLPDDQLGEQGLSAEALTQPGNRARLPVLLPRLASRARELLDQGRRSDGLPPFARIRTLVLEDLLRELEASEFDVADQRIGLTPLRKLWLAWREGRAR